MNESYPIIIVPLSEQEGGGYLGLVPDLVGCMSDGETREEALENTQDAIQEWLDAARLRELDIPDPHSAAEEARREKEALMGALKDLTTDVDHVEARLQDLEKLVTDLHEKIDHADAWTRFSAITGIERTAVQKAKARPLPC